eukprot:jgi/Mesvir1/4881/Mv11150-RA.1
MDPRVDDTDSEAEDTNAVYHNTIRFTPDGYVYVLNIISTCLYMREDGMVPPRAQRLARGVYEKLKRAHGSGHGVGHLPQCFSYYPPGRCSSSLPPAATVEGAKHVVSLLPDLPPAFQSKVSKCKDFPSLINTVMNVNAYKKSLADLQRPPSPSKIVVTEVQLDPQPPSEACIQEALAAALGAEREVACRGGKIDLLCRGVQLLIEVKELASWTHGIGQLHAYGEDFPTFKKRQHLFRKGTSYPIDKILFIKEVCVKQGIELTLDKTVADMFPPPSKS